jgi:hypothetical protein
LPLDSYHGAEIIDIAKKIIEVHHNQYLNINYDDKKILDHDANNFFKLFSTNYLLALAKKTLSNYGINFDI